MRWIDKRTEPPELTERRALPPELGGTYAAVEKQPLRKKLLNDQGYLCAFCMSRIEATEQDMKIAHIYPQGAPNGHLHELRWTNMVGACKGNEGAPGRDQTCDTSQGNRILTLSPLVRASVQRVSARVAAGKPTGQRGESKMRGIELYSDDLAVDRDVRDVLGLNEGYLPANREAILRAFQQVMKQRHPAGQWTAAQVRVVYDQWKWEDSAAGKLRAFCGIVEVKYAL